jgi:hypothetical protein
MDCQVRGLKFKFHHNHARALGTLQLETCRQLVRPDRLWLQH